MAVSPDRRFLYVGTRGEPKLAVGFAIDPASGRLKHVASGPARRQHGVHRHRSHRQILARRFVSRPQAHREPDRIAGHRAAASPGLDGSPECSLDPPRREQSARRRVDARERPRQRVQVRRRHRHAGAGLAPVRPREGKGGPATFRLPSERQLVYVLGELDASVYVFDYDAATRAAQGKAEHQRPAARFPGQAVGRRSPHHARRQVPLRLGAHVEHAGRLQGQSGQRHAFIHRQRADREAARAASTSTPPAATCWRSVSSPTRCRATGSIRRAAS